MHRMGRFFGRYLEGYHSLPRAVWLNVMAVFVINTGTILSSIFTLFLNSRHYSVASITMVLSVGGLGGILGSLLGGVLCQRFLANRVSQVALLGYAAALLAYPSMHRLTYIAFTCVWSNFMYGVFRPANNLVLFSHAAVVDRPRVMALYRVCFNLGLAFGTTLGSYLAAFSFNYFFFFSALMAFCAAGVLFKFHEALAAKPLPRGGIQTDLKEVPKAPCLGKGSFFFLCVLFFMFNLIYLQVRSTFGLYLFGDVGLSVQAIAYLFLINFVMIIFLEVPLMNYFKRVNQLGLIALGTLSLGLGMAILPLLPTHLGGVFSTVFWSLGEVLSTSPFYVLAVRYAPENQMAWYNGIFQSVLSAAIVCAPLWGGFLFPLARGVVLWWTCVVFAALTVLGCLWLWRHEAIPELR